MPSDFAVYNVELKVLETLLRTSIIIIIIIIIIIAHTGFISVKTFCLSRNHN